MSIKNLSRREFLGFSGAVVAFMSSFSAVAYASSSASESKKSGKNKYPFSLPELPYSSDALEPYISAKTLAFHYNKHHQAYIDNLNKLVAGTKYSEMNLEKIILSSWKNRDKDIAIFNNAAQAWNHNFFWHSMKKNGGGKPSGKILKLIERDFESYKNFVQKFSEASTKHFGSGWCWLVLGEDKKLSIRTTTNAELPQIYNEVPLLTLDLWEHSYYLDYQNRRVDYLNDFFKYLVNWNLVEQVI